MCLVRGTGQVLNRVANVLADHPPSFNPQERDTIIKMNTNKNIKSLKSDCDLIAMLTQLPDGKTAGKGVEYRYYDTADDKDLVVEHSIVSSEPLTKNDIRLLAFLIEHVDADNNVRVTGADLFAEFGYSHKLFDSVDAICALEMTDSILNLATKQSEDHKFKAIEYITFADERESTDWDSVGEDTMIRFKLYDRFVAVYLHHDIADLDVSIDDMIKVNQSLVKALELEVSEFISKPKSE